MARSKALELRQPVPVFHILGPNLHQEKPLENLDKGCAHALFMFSRPHVHLHLSRTLQVAHLTLACSTCPCCLPLTSPTPLPLTPLNLRRVHAEQDLTCPKQVSHPSVPLPVYWHPWPWTAPSKQSQTALPAYLQSCCSPSGQRKHVKVTRGSCLSPTQNPSAECPC